MSPYVELVERCADIIAEIGDKNNLSASAHVLAEVLRTLKAPTEEMLTVAGHDWAADIWLAMLRASPLEPPK